MGRVDDIDIELGLLQQQIVLATNALKKQEEYMQHSFAKKIYNFFMAPYKMFKEQWKKGSVLGVLATGALCLVATLTLVFPVMAIAGKIWQMRQDDKRIVLEHQQQALLAKRSELEAEKILIQKNDSVKINEAEKQRIAEMRMQDNMQHPLTPSNSEDLEKTFVMTYKKS